MIFSQQWNLPPGIRGFLYDYIYTYMAAAPAGAIHRKLGMIQPSPRDQGGLLPQSLSDAALAAG
jgi:hypothetical protein